MTKAFVSVLSSLLFVSSCDTTTFTPTAQAPTSGVDTIDVLGAVDTILQEELTLSGSLSGSILLIDVASGSPVALRGLVRTASGNLEMADERIASTPMEHGGLMMLPALFIALKDERVQLDGRFSRDGGRHIVDRVVMRDPAHITDDSLSVAEAFVQRSNVGIAKAMADAYPKDGGRVLAALHAEGLLQPDLMDASRMPWVAIGYEGKRTSLQLLQWYASIAEAYAADEPPNKAVTAAHDLLLRSAAYLETSGLAGTLGDVAGQIAHMQGQGEDGRQVYRTAFAGYFPAKAPRTAFLIVTERSTTEGYHNAGATLRIAQRLIPVLGTD
jgi:hypothetical protein